MKAVDILRLGEKFLKLMSDCELRRDDWKHIALYEEYMKIVAGMIPRASWTREQWQSVMNQHSHKLEDEPCYNRCALWVTMNMVMSDSKDTLEKYVDKNNIFEMVYDLAVDKLCDEDKMFNIRNYFNV
jgi:hypothetical protein